MLLQAPEIAFAILFQFCPKHSLTCERSFVCFKQLSVQPVHKCFFYLHTHTKIVLKHSSMNFPQYKCGNNTIYLHRLVTFGPPQYFDHP